MTKLEKNEYVQLLSEGAKGLSKLMKDLNFLKINKDLNYALIKMNKNEQKFLSKSIN